MLGNDHGRNLRAMKTILYEQRVALDALTEVERPIPEPGPRDLLVRVHAVSLNYRDLAIARGDYGVFNAPLVPVSDAVGEVVRVGTGVTRFTVGDRVSPTYVPDWIDGPVRAQSAVRRLGGPTPGVLSEYVCVGEMEAVRAPSTLSDVEAATLPIAGVSAWQAVVADGNVRSGDVVGVTGTGGASLFVVQIARAAGARVVVVGRDASKLARVAQLGAVTVDATREPDWEHAVAELSGGGVDLFVDMIGGDALGRSIRATRVGGAVGLFGFVADTRASIDLVSAIRRSVTLRATSGGSRASFEALVRAIETNGIRPVVDRVFDFDLDHVRAAFAHLAEGRPFGKVVVRMAA